MKTISTFEYFIGTWKIKRILGSKGKAGGVATFTSCKPFIIKYKEDVFVKFDTFEELYEAYKEYTHKYNSRTKIISKYFKGNNKFYDLEFVNAK